MGKFVTPKVYLLGYSHIHFDGLMDYLTDTGNQRFADSIQEAKARGISDGEILCSFYAKLCYAALTLGHNSNVTRVRDINDNLINCFAQGHGSVFEHAQLNFVATNCSRVFCYEEGTEVFTEVGWRKIETLGAGQNILALDQASGMARWTPIESMHSFPYEGEMLAWSNSQMLSPLMTPDHVLWLAWHDVRRARRMSLEENVWRYGQKVTFREAFGKRFIIRKDIPWPLGDDGDRIRVGERDYDAISLFSWLGWMATDGGFAQDRHSRCTITQSKPTGIARIRALMDDLFPGRWKMHGPYGESKQIQFTIYDRALSDFARKHLGPSKDERSLSRWLLDAGTSRLRAFLDAVIDGDGHRHPKNGHVCIYVPSEHAAGQYQVIAAMLGMPANVRQDNRVGLAHEVSGKMVAQTKPSFIVDLSRRGGGTLVKQEYQFRQQYSGNVYCPKTAEGIIYVRKTGHAFWAGNTHELVRHRVGTAFSQTSGRYVRGDTINLIFDPILDPVRQEAWELISTIEVAYNKMVEKLGLDKMTDFSAKKKMTSALRRFLPNGQANEIGFSVNLRALRHTVQMRTSRQAEWEIRLVFEQVYNLTKAMFPLLYWGSTAVVVDDVVEVSGMKMQPYEASQ